MTDRIERIRHLLEEALAPESLTIRDDSHRHAGHAGVSPEGQTHLHITVISSKFQGKTLPARHRMVYAALQNELAAGLHALSLDTRAP
jgi:BolA protein